MRISVFALILIAASTVMADDVTLTLTDDTEIADDAGSQENADRNFGSRPKIFVSTWGPRYGLIRFDAAGITGAHVQQATLVLYLRSIASCGDITLHAVTTPWSEDSVTWNSQPMFEPEEFRGVALCSGESEPASIGPVSIDVTELAQRWADGSLPDTGLLLRARNSNPRPRFDSKEQPGGFPARLEVTTGEQHPQPAEKIIDLSTIPYVIDEPGWYTLDQDWTLDAGDSDLLSFIEVNSDKVTIDFQGHRLKLGSSLPIIGIDINGSGVMIRNGVIDMSTRICSGFPAIRGAGNDIRILDMLVFGFQAECNGFLGISLSGLEHQVIRVDTTHAPCDPRTEPCQVISGASVHVGDDALVKDNNLFCDYGPCLTAGSSSIIANNRVRGDGGVRVDSDNLVVNNITRSIETTGTDNTVENNWLR